jgi:hypothetical protein
VNHPVSDRVHQVSRRLRSRCEAIFGILFYIPETVGLNGELSPVQWYMAGRIAPLGKLEAEPAAAILGSFNPLFVHAGLDGVWSIISPEQVIARRLASVMPSLSRIVDGEDPGLARAVAVLDRAVRLAETAGHPLFAGLAAVPAPEDLTGRLWRLCELVREHRGDAHVSAWRSFGLDPVEVNVLNELWRAVPAGSIACANMGWDTGEVLAATTRLQEAGLVSAGQLTPAGLRIREDIELATSRQQSSLVNGLGGEADELIGLLDPWARAAVASYRPAVSPPGDNRPT